MKRTLVALIALLGACTDFESPSIVLDLRVLGVVAEPPEVLVPADPDMVQIDDLGTAEFCALIADPVDDRRLGYSFTACPRSQDGRCDPEEPSLSLGGGTVDDPESAATPVSICATLSPQPALLEILQASISADSLQGFGAIDIQIVLAVWPEELGSDAAEYARKAMRFGAAVPAERTPNANPDFARVRVARDPSGGRGLDFDLPRGRCADVEPFLMAPGEEVQLLPEPAAGAREDYVVPTFEGDVRGFTETLTYQFHATAGDWTRFGTGGVRDIAGNEPPTDSRWTAPAEPGEVALWIVQRDERGGQSWFPSCARVR